MRLKSGGGEVAVRAEGEDYRSFCRSEGFSR